MASMCSKEKTKQLGKRVLVHKVIVKRYKEIGYIKGKEELMWLRLRRVSVLEHREYEIAGCPGEYIPARRHAPLPPNFVENFEKRRNSFIQAWRSFPVLSKKQFPSPLEMFLQTRLPLPATTVTRDSTISVPATVC